MLVEYTQEFWDDRYRERSRIWSGNPNRQLVAIAGDLPPGRALDVGCGEGADAVWLASRGWTVLGVDVSEVALERAREHSAGLEPDVAARVGIGGSFLVVAHDPSDLHSGIGRPHQQDLFHTPEQIAGLLDEAWDVRLRESRPRVERRDGREHSISDAVVHAVRVS